MSSANLIEQIKTMLKRVPQSVLSGGSAKTTEFRRFHANMTKTIAKPRLTDDQVLSAFNQTLAWYTE